MTKLVVRREVYRNFTDMFRYVPLPDLLPEIQSVDDGLAVLYSFRQYRELELQYGVVAFWLEDLLQDAVPEFKDPQWTSDQLMHAAKIAKIIEKSMILSNSEDVVETDETAEWLWNNNKILTICGPLGSGKTSLIHGRIYEWLRWEANILFALPTAALASRIREIYRNSININTCHAGAPSLSQYNLICVDEVSQVTAGHFERIGQLWSLSDRSICLVFLGDKWQMAGFGNRAWQTPLWR